MTYFDEKTMPMDSTEHDAEDPEMNAMESTALDEADLEAAIEQAEDYALDNEELLLQEGAGDFEEEPPKEESKRKKRSKSEKKDEANPPKEPLSDETEPDFIHEESDLSENLPEDLAIAEENDYFEETELSNGAEATDDEALIRRPQSLSTDKRFYMDEDGKYVEDVSSPHRAQHQRISSAFNRRDLLTGFVEGFELNSSEIPRVFLYAGDIKVVIPLSHLDLPLTAEELKDPLEARLAVNGILGAKIFYMVLDINFSARVAVASRTYANQRRRSANLNHRSRDAVYKIRPGVLCTAQVMHVAERFVRIDIYGFPATIGVSHISNLWVSDIREVLTVGSEIMVELVSVERNPNSGAVTNIVASMKLAEQQATVRLEQNKTYTGTVSGFSQAAYFVRVAGLDSEVRCPIGKCYTGKLIEVGDYIKFFVESFREDAPSGSILKILKKTERSMLEFY